MASEHVGQNGQNRLLATLASEDHSLLIPHFKELSLELGSLLQEAGEPVEFVYFPHEGMVSLLAVMSDGIQRCDLRKPQRRDIPGQTAPSRHLPFGWHGAMRQSH